MDCSQSNVDLKLYLSFKHPIICKYKISWENLSICQLSSLIWKNLPVRDLGTGAFMDHAQDNIMSVLLHHLEWKMKCVTVVVSTQTLLIDIALVILPLLVLDLEGMSFALYMIPQEVYVELYFDFPQGE